LLLVLLEVSAQQEHLMVQGAQELPPILTPARLAALVLVVLLLYWSLLSHEPETY
jgi:hypothetical protein